MKTKTSISCVLIICATLFTSRNYAQHKITANDIDLLIGNWTGTLTYIDYSTGNPFTMPANLEIKQAKSRSQFLLSYIYPNEPKANSTDKIKISKKGDLLNKKPIISKETTENNNIKIVTEFKGKDNNKPAVIRHIYILSKDTFIMKKKVKFKDSNAWLLRNEYNFKR